MAKNKPTPKPQRTPPKVTPKVPNLPSKTTNPSGAGRGNNPPKIKK